MIKQLITAKATAVLYHGTGIIAASKILTQDKFLLKPSDGTEAEDILAGGRSGYYLSCARSMLSEYIQNLGQSWLCILELDGTALSTKYRIRPVDYWAGMNRDEMEDRVWSQAPAIPALRYIKRVYVSVPDSMNDTQRKAIRNIALSCKRANLEVKFYAASGKRLNPRADKPIALNLDDLKIDPKATKYFRRPMLQLTGWLALYKMPATERDRLRNHKDAYRVSKNLPYSDAINVLNADLHNAKGDTDEESRKQLEEFLRVLRTNRWTPKDYIKSMQDKWL